jgi:hypothetical protein
MTRTASSMATLLGATALAALTGCPGPDPTGNPPELWLAPNGSEVVVQLIDHEPPPF